jgi:predicted nucleotidyltransferase
VFPNSRVNNIVNDLSNYFTNLFDSDTRLIWFGSWMRGDAYLQSDIDLAIFSKKPLDESKLVNFWQYADDFPTLYKIDLVDMNNADYTLRKQILKDGKIL